MNLEDLEHAVDYFEKVDKSSMPLAVSGIAVIISLFSAFVALYAFKKHYDHNRFIYLANIWHDLLDSAEDMPLLTARNVTNNYYLLLSGDELRKYDIFCYKAWGHVEDIVTAKYEENEQFEPIIRWVTAYHYAWLRRNPTFFTVPKFWTKVEEMKDEPSLVFGYTAIPSKNGEIDWDIVSANYHEHILSPFAPEMVSSETGVMRNKAVEYIKNIPIEKIANMEIADFGCGPGNLIPHIGHTGCKLTGIDISAKALQIAAERASETKIFFKKVCCDFKLVETSHKYDIVVSINSLLPSQRSDIILTLRKMRDSLKPSGKLVMVLPSYDTVEYLLGLWVRFYDSRYRSETHAERIAAAFRETKKMSRDTKSYADDGINVQCYHTPETISEEFAQSGLKLAKPLEKIYYPWTLSKKFDYGYFPDASEEIWDWFAVAEAVSVSSTTK